MAVVFDTSRKGCLPMNTLEMILIIVILAMVIESIKKIKK